MKEIAVELLPYLATIIGFLIVYVLTDIKNKIRDVGVAITSLEHDLREGMSNLDRRISCVENRCNFEHGKIQ